jgi:hypothetical protein
VTRSVYTEPFTFNSRNSGDTGCDRKTVRFRVEDLFALLAPDQENAALVERARKSLIDDPLSGEQSRRCPNDPLSTEIRGTEQSGFRR